MRIWQRGEYSRDGTPAGSQYAGGTFVLIGRTPVRQAVGVVDSSFELIQIDLPFCA
jgi:hypothetical protein